MAMDGIENITSPAEVHKQTTDLLWNIGSQIGSLRNSVWMRRPYITDINQGTSLWVSLAKEQKVESFLALW